jgi:hypothetical protein|tara:strand:+ start:322 stop:585 length:264 start_codon:yes stop_codon:yes gene_type:complete
MIEEIRHFLRLRGQSYRKTFEGVHGERVLEDLARFCRAHSSTFHTDPRVEGIMQGRREVWLRLAHHLNMSEEQLWNYYNPGEIRSDD